MIRRVLLACLAAISCAATSAQVESPVEIVCAEFGIFDASKPGELVFEPTRVVPRRQGQSYGWIIEVNSRRRSLSVREEYLLATPPLKAEGAGDSISESLSLPVQRRSQVSQRQLVPVDSKIYGEWELGPNEAAGHRHLQVVVEGQLAASFEYDVE